MNFPFLITAQSTSASPKPQTPKPIPSPIQYNAPQRATTSTVILPDIPQTSNTTTPLRLPQTPKHRIQSEPLRLVSRRQSSPSHLLIKDSDLLRKVQQTLPSVNSTPIKLLENRRKYAPLTPAGRERPKFLAGGPGIISVEPTIRKTLSQGSLVKGINISFDLIPAADNNIKEFKNKSAKEFNNNSAVNTSKVNSNCVSLNTECVINLKRFALKNLDLNSL